jgi:MoaA/NifB/PqqE/SkfB family radical SAM enzyme
MAWIWQEKALQVFVCICYELGTTEFYMIRGERNMKFKKITVCLDMYGCPNRCKHCWLGTTPNGNLSIDDLIFVAEEFRPYTDNLEISDRYREEDYNDNYKELWRITTELSDTKTPHFENISYWRAVRDNEYVQWLSSLGVKAAQLTIFGDEATTDYYVGRKGAFQEILYAIDILLKYGIAPRILDRILLFLC